MHKLVAVVGMPGSGKGEVTSFFEKLYKFKRVYFGQITLDVLAQEKREITSENEKEVRERLRAQEGMDAYAKRSLPMIRQLIADGSNVVIDGLYSWEEYLVLRAEFPEMVVLAVTAAPERRYERLAVRPVRPLTRDEAVVRDHAQIENLHTGGPIAMADVNILNMGDLNDLSNAIYCLLYGDPRR